MTDSELLLAMSEMMDRKLEPIKKEISKVSERNKNIEVMLENNVIPRLQNIESCTPHTVRYGAVTEI